MKIAITIISLLCAIIFKSQIDWSNWGNNYVDVSLVKEILYDLSIGVFSAMILVWFIDEIGTHIQERKSKDKERDTIKRLNKIIFLYIDQYMDLFYCVVTPIEERDPDNVRLPGDFTLSDMRDLYLPSSRLNEKFHGSSVEAFLRVEQELREKFIHIIESYDFEYYPQIIEILSGYVKFSLAFDSRIAILDALNNTTVMSQDGEQQKKTALTTFIHDWLEKDADAYFQNNLNKENVVANPLFHPYICLYQLMRHERDYILKYIEEDKILDL